MVEIAYDKIEFFMVVIVLLLYCHNFIFSIFAHAKHSDITYIKNNIIVLQAKPNHNIWFRYGILLPVLFEKEYDLKSLIFLLSMEI